MKGWYRDCEHYECERWVYEPSGNNQNAKQLRILKIDGEWQVRFDGMDEAAIRERLPTTLPLEEVQAAAIAIWRMA